MTTTFDDVRLPPDVEQGAKGGPTFQTSIIGLSGGIEQRVGNWEQARQPWDVGYGIQAPEDFNPVRDFFYARRGKLRAFRFRDYSDYQCSGEQIGVGDGHTRTFLFGKTYESDGPTPFFRRITRPVADTINVYVDGLLADPGDYDLAVAGGYVRFHVDAAPANTKLVTFDCEFDIPVRFDVDNLDMTLYWVRAGMIPHLPVIEIRDVVNDPPEVSLINTVTTLAESTSTAAHVRVADVVVDDDPFGADELTLTGADAQYFELVGTLDTDGVGVSLYLKAGTSLNVDTKASYAVTVNVSDPTISASPTDTVDFTLTITAVAAAPHVALSNLHASLAWNEDTTSHVRVADVAVTQHHPGASDNVLSLSGTNASVFELGSSTAHGAFNTSLYIKAGTAGAVDVDHPTTYSVVVEVANADFASPPQDTKPLSVTFGVAGATTTVDTSGGGDYLVPEYQTLVIEGWGGGAGAAGSNAGGTDGGNTFITAMSLMAHGGKAAPLTVVSGGLASSVAYNTQGGDGGTATGGDENHTGGAGGNGMAKRLVDAGQTVTSGAGGSSGGTGGGSGGAAVNAVAPAAPYSGDACTASPPSPYPVPGTVANTDGSDGVLPGGAGSGCAVAGWEVVLTLAAGYCWSLYAQGRPGAGAGGHFKKTFLRGVTAGAPVPGDHISYTVGAAGVGGADAANGGDGAKGRMKFVTS